MNEALVAQMEEEEEMEEGGRRARGPPSRPGLSTSARSTPKTTSSPDFASIPSISTRIQTSRPASFGKSCEAIYDNGKERKQSNMLFFKEDFDPKLYLAHTRRRWTPAD